MSEVTTSAHDDFMGSIIASPDDDAPRLVYADWLEEHGGEPERAEFIRCQIELAKPLPQTGAAEARKAANILARYRKGAPVPLKAKTPAMQLVRDTLRIEFLRDAELRLLTSKGGEWIEQLDHFENVGIIWPNVAGKERMITLPPGRQFQFRRGFVERIIFAWSDWLLHDAAILASTPLLDLELTARPTYDASVTTDAYVEYWFPSRPDKRVTLWETNHNLVLLKLLKENWPTIKDFHVPEEPPPATRGGASAGMRLPFART